MHRLTLRLRHLALCAWLGLASGWVAAQPSPEAAAETYSQEELDQILAPVALYPDTLLMQVLAAATYQLEIVEAERYIRANPKLKGEAMTRAAANKAWDLSVISLLQFPSVLTMMNDKLDWTQQLGDVFLAQQPEVMDTVQALRARAAGRQPEEHCAAVGGGAGKDHRDRAGAAAGGLCALLQPDGGLRALVGTRPSALVLAAAADLQAAQLR